MTLKQAVKKVIEQNIACKYNPTRFRQMTENGESNDLNKIIGNLVLDRDTLNAITNASEQYGGRPIFIEEFITMYGFGLPDNVINEAKERTKAIQELRWIKKR